MTESTNGLLLLDDWMDALQELPAKDFKALVTAMSDFVRCGKEPPQFEGVAKMAAGFVFSALRAERQKRNHAKRAASNRWNKEQTANSGSKNACKNDAQSMQCIEKNDAQSMQCIKKNDAQSMQCIEKSDAQSMQCIDCASQKERESETETEKESEKERSKEKDKEKAKEKEKGKRKDTPASPPQGGARAAEAAGGDGGGEEGADKRSPRFSKPTVEEVEAYCKERKNLVSAEDFCDFYASKGWRVGKEPMKDWRAAVRLWERRRKEELREKGLPEPAPFDPELHAIFHWGDEDDP